MLPWRLVLTILVPFLLVLVGAVGFHFLEDLPLFEAFYLAVITLTTVGYGDIYPKTMAGRTFTLLLVVGGVFSFFYAATALIRAIVSGEVGAMLGKAQMERALADLKNHIIVCGYGRMGRLVCREFSGAGLPFVVIDKNAAALEDFQLPHGLALHGDAASDEMLSRAGVERARGLVTVMASDADNLYTTMSARLLHHKLVIVARVEDPQSEQKLVRAGANRVVSPYQIGGRSMAQAVLRPTVVDFIELATRTEHIELQLEEARIHPHSPLTGASLKDSRLRADLKVIIVAIKKPSGKMIFNPPAETTIEVGDILLAIGHREQLDQLASLAHRPPD
jgi:voltage-gated potassium channel